MLQDVRIGIVMSVDLPHQVGVLNVASMRHCVDVASCVVLCLVPVAFSGTGGTLGFAILNLYCALQVCVVLASI